jgi:hypothetical protein
MSGGWRNDLMQNETDFIALDGAMVAIAALVLTIWHPGYCFPQMVPSNRALDEEKRGRDEEKLSAASEGSRVGVA